MTLTSNQEEGEAEEECRVQDAVPSPRLLTRTRTPNPDPKPSLSPSPTLTCQGEAPVSPVVPAPPFKAVPRLQPYSHP